MKAFGIMIFVLFLLLVFIMLACKKESDEQKKLLQQNDWEQLGQIPWDSSYNEHKFFHTLRFNADNTYFMETNWSLYDVLMDTESGIYEYDADDDLIIFPYPIDTIDQQSLFLQVCLHPWQILQLDDTILVVQSRSDIPTENPCAYSYYDQETLYFRPQR